MLKKVYIALGSNLGDKSQNITIALTRIGETVGTVVKRSSDFHSLPWGYQSDNNFVNAVAEISTQLTVDDLLKELKLIEQELGRKPKESDEYTDRIIDLDIIDYNSEQHNTDHTIVPHPRMQLRDFVIVPLAEIAPEWTHPILEIEIAELLKRFESTSL